MSDKRKSLCTAATVAEAKENNNQNQNSTIRQGCKASSDTDDHPLRMLGKILRMEESHYIDGLNGKPYCNKFTYAGYAAVFGESPDGDEDLKGFFGFCDGMLRESWKRGRADAITGKHAAQCSGQGAPVIGREVRL